MSGTPTVKWFRNATSQSVTLENVASCLSLHPWLKREAGDVKEIRVLACASVVRRTRVLQICNSVAVEFDVLFVTDSLLHEPARDQHLWVPVGN